MAGKGGGSWKVAYADFVTAMMAFFLVMWIGAQDVKVRQSVANYFIDPLGSGKMYKEQGSVLPDPTPGSVPKEAAPGTTQGQKAAANGPPSPSTAAVMRWVDEDPQRLNRWLTKAKQCKARAAQQKDATSNVSPDEAATRELENLLRAEIADGVPKDAPDVYKDLIFGSFKEVNWRQVADHLFSQS